MYTLTTDEAMTALDDTARLLTPDGCRIADARLDPWVEDLDGAALRGLYRDMAIARRMDAEGVALQRQGHLGLWAPAQGQEAIAVGTARACRADDFLFPSYRELSIAILRGGVPADLVLAWRGEVHSTYDPFELRLASPQIIIGAQTLHAVGYAMGIQRDGGDQVAVTYFGDGASSQGDVNEAMVFASSFTAPVVFVCSNNQWAISEPVGLQAVRPIADRAPGFGIPSVRVDGNDVLAVMAVTRQALDRARRGEGPTFIEAVTYRMGPHTTSDDPTRYVDPTDREAWAGRDPLLRVERLLEREGLLDDQVTTAVKNAADAAARGMRAGCLGLTVPEPLSLFDHVYATPSAWLERQRSQYAAYLAMYVEEDAPQGGAR